ncbi:hypothetical protein [Bacillus albus]|uniref:hypothetical protein n=1 Tax=Bacillus albus TaxID=2026189 RepID=UPI00209F00A5|nr:hypothetical protein [Bacillus albus]
MYRLAVRDAKKWGIILLTFEVIFAGFSSKTDQKVEKEDVEKTTEVKNEKEKSKVEGNKKGETNKSLKTANSATSFGAGMYKVDVDVPSGEYMLIAQSGIGYFSINSGSTVSQLKNNIENGNFNGERYLKVNNDQYLMINLASIKVFGKISVENVSLTEEIKLTNKQEDGMHFWKAEKEIITRHDWMALSDTEKTKLIQLSMDHIQLMG